MILGKSLAKALGKSVAKSLAGGDTPKFVVTFSCTNGSVTATVDGVTISSGTKVERGKTVVFTITPDEGYEYTGTNPESVVVEGEVTKTYECTLKVYVVTFSCTNGVVGATVDGMGIQSGASVALGKTVVFTITPDEGYEYTGTNPESVVVTEAITKAYVCEVIRDYLKFTCLESSGNFCITNEGSNNPNCEYSTDKVNWNTLSKTPITITSDTPIYVRGNNPTGWATSDSNFTHFYSNAVLSVSGSVMALIDKVGESTTIPNAYCFYGLFDSTPIRTVSADLLPATTLTVGCYDRMFNLSTYLTSIPEGFLPATNLTQDCYREMFHSCHALVTVPSNLLSSTSLANGCYREMFRDCPLLTTAPILPTETLIINCYYKMFIYCTTLSDVTCLATDISAADSTGEWLGSVASTGTFHRAASMTSWTTGTSGIPEGWEVDPPTTNYLTFTCTYSVGAGSGVWWYTNTAGYESIIYYSLNDGEWTEMPTTKETAIYIVNGDVIRFKGNNTYVSYNRNVFSKFGMEDVNNSKITVSGSVMSLLDGTGESTTLSYNYCFNALFQGITSITKVGNICPATTISAGCYYHMLYNCKGLVDISEFILPALSVKTESYSGLFSYCEKLTTAPELPATTLGSTCYNQMFLGCKLLTIAPELPVTTLVSSCYQQMFQGCTALTEIHCSATDISASNCTTSWLSNVSSTGDFYTPSSTSWTEGSSGIPSGWTRHDE